MDAVDAVDAMDTIQWADGRRVKQGAGGSHDRQYQALSPSQPVGHSTSDRCAATVLSRRREDEYFVPTYLARYPRVIPHTTSPPTNTHPQRLTHVQCRSMLCDNANNKKSSTKIYTCPPPTCAPLHTPARFGCGPLAPDQPHRGLRSVEGCWVRWLLHRARVFQEC